MSNQSESHLSSELMSFVARRICNPMKGAGTIYYIGCPETYRLKIGFTNGDPRKRLRTLRTGSPTKISLMAMHPGFIEDEAAMHNFFAAKRLHGEWFQCDDLLFEFLAYVAWASASVASHNGSEVPRWAKVALDAIKEDFGPMPLIGAQS